MVNRARPMPWACAGERPHQKNATTKANRTKSKNGDGEDR